MVVLALRGTCTFASKIDNVAAGGALAAVIYNNGTASPFVLSGQTVGAAMLPALFVNQADGADLTARAAASPGFRRRWILRARLNSQPERIWRTLPAAVRTSAAP
jgi:hypothetical protein